MERIRQPRDEYQTPELLAEHFASRALSFYEEANSTYPNTILEPTCGTGMLVKALREAAPNARIDCCDTLASERSEKLLERGASIVHQGPFEKLDIPMGHFDLIVTNPPFSDWQDIFLKCHLVAKPGGVICFLLGLNVLGARKYQELLTTYHPAELCAINPRPVFLDSNENPIVALTGKNAGKPQTDMKEYAVLIWQKGFNKGLKLRPLSWKDKKKKKVS